eukprot:TRINITY_DN2515_c0_g1_i1.p2 TRINITY_DN2515_c0_g1~~TRINITY_DN2515_c0_g1_i1.p2  ORF type:complete len:377 (+),score=81.08 TRINITY_DN2515_c0_g1_i1:190-1320(+)
MFPRSLASFARFACFQVAPSRQVYFGVLQRLCSTSAPVPVHQDAILPSQEGTALKAFTMYQGASSQAVTAEQSNQLQAPLDEQDIEIRPDGLLYFPEIRYRRVLNRVFGPGGWALIPMGQADISDSGPIAVVSREYALFAGGRFISAARGEQDYHAKGAMSYATAVEAAKSNAMMRCCKDLGIASELWDPRTTQQLRDKLFERVFAAKYDGKVSPVWIRKGLGESGLPAGYKLSSSKSSTLDKQPPPPTLDAVELPPAPGATTVTASAATKKPAVTSAAGIMQAAEKKAVKSANPNRLPSAAVSDASPASAPKSLDLDGKVPAKFKKIAGKTWKQVATDPKGVQYLQWLVKQENVAERTQVENALTYASQIGVTAS